MDDQQQQVTEVAEAPSKIVINGTEYDVSEATELLDKGKFARDLEKQWNSPIDTLASAYGKSQNTVKQTQAELEKYKSQVESFNQKQNAGTDTAQDREKARQAAKALGIVLDEDVKDKYISSDKFDEMLEERLAKREAQKEAVNKILSEATDLEKEFNGEDGRPKFNRKVVMAYAATYGHKDLKSAYEDMHADTLKSWADSQVKANKRPSVKTITNTSATKEPKAGPINDDNMKDALNEALYGSH